MGKAVVLIVCEEPECGKVFSRRADLNRHMNIHTGNKPFICGTCGKGFSQPSGLKTHVNVHTGEKPHLCGHPGCEAAFGDPSSCARHRKETHQRILGYRCPEPCCYSRIKRRSAFAAHLSKKHGIEPTSVNLESFAPPLLQVTSGGIQTRTRRRSIKLVKVESLEHKLEEEFQWQISSFEDALSWEGSPDREQTRYDVACWPQYTDSTPVHSGSSTPSFLETPPSDVNLASYFANRHTITPPSGPSSPIRPLQYLSSSEPSSSSSTPSTNVKSELLQVEVPRLLYADPLLHDFPNTRGDFSSMYYEAIKGGYSNPDRQLLAQWAEILAGPGF